jgi:murein L,D-transpeptidase YcbB/YkuD
VAAYRCDDVFSTLLAEASGEVADLHDRVDEGVKVEGLGEVCEKLIAGTLERYEAKASEFADEPVFERKRRELEAILDTGLNAVYLRQLQILREEAIKAFKASLEDELPADYAIFAADASFVSAAKAGQRPASISLWSYASERADLQSMLSEIAAQHRKLVATQVTASEQQSKAIQFLQMQHAQMRAVQQQALGGRTGQWSVGAAYRPPDSNVNVSVGFQQGRTNVQISMVPDESASLLGPNGFTSGVGIGNLGLSFNLNA